MHEYLEFLPEEEYNSIKQDPDNFNWNYITSEYRLSENFIREYICYLSFWYICQYQLLSCDFMREFKDKIYWSNISYKIFLIL